MSRKVTLDLDDDYEAKVRRRVEQLKTRREAELRESGYTEKADEVADSEPDFADYVRELVLDDLRDAGVIDR